MTEDIAGLIKRANDGSINTDRAEDRKLFAELGDALRAQAQEIERWKSIHSTSDVMHLEKTEFMLNQKEAERDQMIRVAKIWQERYEEAIEGQIAIRSKTIEAHIEVLRELLPEGAASLAEKAIRALAPKDEAKA